MTRVHSILPFVVRYATRVRYVKSHFPHRTRVILFVQRLQEPFFTVDPRQPVSCTQALDYPDLDSVDLVDHRFIIV
jgi:hypothetical protein